MLTEFQKEIKPFSSHVIPDRYLLGLVEEVLEVMEVLETTDAMINESCDCYVYLSLLANSFGITLKFQTISTINKVDATLKLFQLVQYYNHGIRKDDLPLLGYYLNQLAGAVCLDSIWNRLPTIIARNETRREEGRYGDDNS